MAVSPAPSSRFPQSVTWAVLVLCVAPPVLNLLGVDFGTRLQPFDPRDYTLLAGPQQPSILYNALRGAFVFTLLEWTAFCIALVTVAMSFLQYFLTKDLITPIIGTALFFSGCVDAFHVLAADLLTENVTNHQQFVPWVWTISRLLNSVIVVAGTLPFLWNDRPVIVNRGVRYTLLTGVLSGLLSFAFVFICARVETFPQIRSAGPEFIRRPLDLIPFVAYLLAAGIVLPRLYRRHRSLFVRGLQVSILPHVVSQLYAVTSAELYDNAFNVASALKIVGYLVPLIGLLVDYTRAYQAHSALRAAQEQLNLAREIQQRLLPSSAPQLPGWSIAGRCAFAEAIGGDYFDYLTLPDGRLRIVVADVSGHDPAASLLMANARAYLRAVNSPSIELAAMFEQVNRFLCDDAQGRRFVTLFAAELSPDSGQVQYVGCGHAALLLAANGACRSLDATGMPLGVSTDYRLHAGVLTNVRSGDVILMCTDGLTEATASNGAMLGREGIPPLLGSTPLRDSAAIVEALFAGVRAYIDRSTFQDDVTVVAALRR